MKKARRVLGLLLSAASYGPFGAFGAIVKATDPSLQTTALQSVRVKVDHRSAAGPYR